MTKRSSGSISTWPRCPERLHAAVAAHHAVLPGAPASLPASLNARVVRPLASIDAVIALKKQISREAPSPPAKRPTPPDPAPNADARPAPESAARGSPRIGQFAVGHVRLQRARAREASVRVADHDARAGAAGDGLVVQASGRRPTRSVKVPPRSIQMRHCGEAIPEVYRSAATRTTSRCCSMDKTSAGTTIADRKLADLKRMRPFSTGARAS